MRKAKNIKVGDVVQFPAYEFAPFRTGWNGWIFRAAIVEQLGTSKKTGKAVAKLTYCTNTAGRYELLPNKEFSKWIATEYCFEYDVERAQKRYTEYKQYEDNGEQVCWDEDTALLVNHGIIK